MTACGAGFVDEEHIYPPDHVFPRPEPRHTVYSPRVAGNRELLAGIAVGDGLSRVCGGTENYSVRHRRGRRSIPACAGEPRQAHLTRHVAQVYPACAGEPLLEVIASCPAIAAIYT